MKGGLPQFPGVECPAPCNGCTAVKVCLFAVFPTGVLFMLAGVWYVCNMAKKESAPKKIDYLGSLADYKKSVSKDDDTAEKRRQSKMVMEADLNDQSKGAEDYINKKYGKTAFSAKNFAKYQDFENEVLDIISEGEVSSRFPTDVWERGAKRYTKELFKKSKSDKK